MNDTLFLPRVLFGKCVGIVLEQLLSLAFNMRGKPTMKDIMGFALGLFLVGLVGSIMAGSIVPLLMVAAVAWALGHFLGGFSGGNRR